MNHGLVAANLYFHHDGLGFGKEFATVLASFAADPAVLEAAERCAQIANEVAVDPDRASPHGARHRVRRRAFSVNTMAFRPYRESFASRMASASPAKGAMVTIGPKISSWLIRISWVVLTSTVGRTHQPRCRPPVMDQSSAASRSASAKTKFALLPPSSKLTRLRVGPLAWRILPSDVGFAGERHEIDVGCGG